MSALDLDLSSLGLKSSKDRTLGALKAKAATAGAQSPLPTPLLSPTPASQPFAGLSPGPAPGASRALPVQPPQVAPPTRPAGSAPRPGLDDLLSGLLPQNTNNRRVPGPCSNNPRPAQRGRPFSPSRAPPPLPGP